MTHLKSLASPKALKIHRKEKVWSTKSSPGPHGLAESIPIVILLRDHLGIVSNRKEARYILNHGKVLVDGRAIKEDRYPIGLLDVVSIPQLEKNYIILVNGRGELYASEVDAKKADKKISKLVNKTMISGGKLQLNMYDGRNIVIDSKDSKKYVTGGSLILKLPDLKIDSFIPADKGKIALVAKGRHSGKIGKIINMTESGFNLKSLTSLDCNGEEVMTNTDYIFIVGDKESMV